MSDANELYDEHYYKQYLTKEGAVAYERSESWLNFFGNIAEHVQHDIAPQTVLDAGCAIGMLVEALVKRGVDAHGFDISEWAIQQMPGEHAARVKVGSVLDPNAASQHYDLVICMEVLEHLRPEDAEMAIRNLCNWGEMVIFTSTPDDYREVTHLNVQPPGYWAEKFAQHGFVRVLDYDATYIATWAQLFRREKALLPVVVRQYENALWQHRQENADLRRLAAQLQPYRTAFERLAQAINAQQPDDQANEARTDELVNRALHYEIRLRDAEQTLQTITHTRGWRMLASWWTLKRRLISTAQKRHRAKQLSDAVARSLRDDGAIGLAKRSARWMRGERRFYQRRLLTPASGLDVNDPFADYPQWIAENEPGADELARQAAEAEQLAYKPVISILTPVYNTDRRMLVEMIDSVRSQTYPHWELCLVDGGSTAPHVWEVLQQYSQQDARLKIRRLPANLGISGNSNAALQLVTGDFVALLDHDDLLAPNALYEVARTLNANPELDFIYSDKDMITQDGSERFYPSFKPDWSPEVLLNTNYLTHLCVLRTTLMREIGGFDLQANGSQDWALFLDAMLRTDRAAHIPKMLYHWRQHPLSVASGTLEAKPYAAESQLRCIQRFLNARGVKGQPVFAEGLLIRIDWETDVSLKVAIVLDVTGTPSNKALERLARQYLSQSGYAQTELILLDRTGNSGDLRNSAFLSADPRIRILTFDPSTTTGTARNRAVECAAGDVFVFLSADLVCESPHAIRELVGWARYPDLGAVTGHLMQPDGTIAHAGYVLNLGGIVGSVGQRLHKYSESLYGPFIWYRNLSAVSGDCLAIRRDQLARVDGFDETFECAGSDIDLCLRLREQAVRHFYTPFAMFRYDQSMPGHWSGTSEDRARLLERHAEAFAAGDPYYNVHLSTNDLIPRLRLRARP